MQRKLSKKAKNDYGKVIINPDVRPLDQREKKLDTRKGMIPSLVVSYNKSKQLLIDWFR